MALYQKVNGAWTVCQRPYAKRNGVWVAVNEAYIKRGGVWVRCYEYDVTPPSPPEITLAIYEDRNGGKLQTRYINVGVRLPGVQNDTDVRLVRVLTTYQGKPPTTQFGGQYTEAPDSTFPSEPWSEWRYNDFGVHGNTSSTYHKQWPRNVGAGYIIPDNDTYYFTGWSLDDAGNWSVGTAASIHVPKDSVAAPSIIQKEVRIQPNTTGSWLSSKWASGRPIAQNSPRSHGLLLYGNQFNDVVGANTNRAGVNVTSCQIYLKRIDADTGSANANVYLFWNSCGTIAQLPAAGAAIPKTDVTKVGTIAKGEAKWFDVPRPMWNNLNNSLRCFGTDYKDPNKAAAVAADFSTMSSVASTARCGEVHITWTEQT